MPEFMRLQTNDTPRAKSPIATKRVIAVFAALGAASGTIAIVIAYFGPNWRFKPLSWVEISHISTLPGVTFGLLIGFALVRSGIARPWGYAGYVAASAVSYLAAFTLALQLREPLDSVALIGLVAGLFGSALLTGATALFFPFARKLRPCLLTLGSGCLLGALLEVFLAGNGVLYGILFFAPWQAGYAASVATALSPMRRK